MQDSELRLALRLFFEDQILQSERFVTNIERAKENSETRHLIDDALDAQMTFLQNIQRAGKQLIQILVKDIPSDDAPPDEGSIEKGPEPAEEEPVLPEAPPDDGEALPALDPFEQTLVAMYNEEPEKWMRKFRPKGFGAENVNEIWEKGGDPRFGRKEGGIYNLVEENGAHYVVPEPDLRLSARYFKSEGVNYLFEVGGISTEHEPLIRLIKPAKVCESGGRWTVLDKGLIGRRHQ